jgi:tripartite-type tricarboxylate transporter receptor subunit TctC
MNTTCKASAFGFALAGAAMMIAGPAFGQSVEQFYSGKTLTLIVSADAGTPTDTLARQFARFFVKHIPGQPQPIVMNVVGAGGMVAASSLQTKQPNDGSVVGFLQRNNLYTSLLEKKTTFDPRKVTWLGSLEKVHYCIVGMTRSGVTTADDIFSKKMTLGATGFTNENRILPALLNDYAGAKFAIVPGYTGRGEVYLAMQREEVDGWASTIDGLNSGEPARLLADGKMNVLLHLAWESHPDFPKVPNLSAYVTKPEAKAVIDFFLSPFDAGRPIALPAGVPQDRVDALRAAFAKTVVDPDYLAAVKNTGFVPEGVDGKVVEEIVAKLYATPESVLDQARAIRSKK